MKFTAYYIDDQKTATVQASSPELAARQFLALYPRSDTSQITVESMPSAPHSIPGITHFRACDLAGRPPPSEEVGEEDLALRIVDSGYPDFVRSFVVAGSRDTLRLLATRLLDALSAGPSESTRPLYRAPVTPTDGSRFPHCLSFELDPDPARRWAHQTAPRAVWGGRVRQVLRLLIGALAGIGVWTVYRWIFQS